VKIVKLSILTIVCIFSTMTSARDYDNITCGISPPKPLTSSYGPFDYTNPNHQASLPIVIGAHFTRGVRRLERGHDVSGNLRYTLITIPNYHPALYAASLYAQQKKLKGAYTAECYFKRAIYFQPKDATSRMLFAMHYQATDRPKQALHQYHGALRISPKAAELNYNYGLFLFDQGQFKRAQQAADIAYKKGYPLQGLKNKLKSHKASLQTAQQ